MDVQIPRMDGMEATRRIRRNASGVLPAAVPIVAMTAHAMKGDREKMMQSGMNEYLNKPIEGEALQKALRSIFALKEKSERARRLHLMNQISRRNCRFLMNRDFSGE